jgi:hypothetical protein
MRIEYRVQEGIISYLTKGDVPTVEDINNVAMRYLEKTNRTPEYVFLHLPILTEITKQFQSTARYNPSFNGHVVDMSITSFMLSTGQITVLPIMHSDVPVLVGSRQEFDDNQIHKLFEEIVLKDCEMAD